jgi:hypothetical protein
LPGLESRGSFKARLQDTSGAFPEFRGTSEAASRSSGRRLDLIVAYGWDIRR